MEQNKAAEAIRKLIYLVDEIRAGNAFSETLLWDAAQRARIALAILTSRDIPA